MSRSTTPVVASAPASGAATPTGSGNGNAFEGLEEGPVDELIMSGSAFGMLDCLGR